MLPLDLTEVSIFLAITEILLLITAQLSSTFYSFTGFVIDRKKLDYASVVAGILFLLTVGIRIIQVIQGDLNL